MRRAEAPRRILLCSASAGAGHLRAAEAVELALRERTRGAVIENVDVLSFASPAFRRLYGKGYVDFVNAAPEVVGALFDRTNRPPKHPAADRLSLAMQRSQLRKFETFVREFDPDLVIHTHFLPATLVEGLRKKRRCNAATAVVVTDYDVHRFWKCSGIGRYFVAREENIEVLARLGEPSETIEVTGIPIHPSFAQPVDVGALRKKHEIASTKPLVLLLSGGFGVGPVGDLAASLARDLVSAQMVVVCGKNAALRADVEKRTAFAGDRVRVLGFTTDMREWMAMADLVVTKPGGLTTSEALACGTAMVVVFPIPGQETRNATMLYEEGVAISGENPSTVGFRVRRLMEDKEKLATMRRNAHRLGRPHAAFDIAERCLRLHKHND